MPAEEKVSSPFDAPPAPPEEPKRGRGRPRKILHAIIGDDESAPKTEKPPAKIKETRGRPRKRVSLEPVWSGIWQGLAPQVSVVSPAAARVVAFEGPAAAMVIDSAVAGTALDRRIFQPLASKGAKFEDVGMLLALPIMVAVIERSPEMRSMLEPYCRQMITVIMERSAEAMERTQARETEVAEKLQALGASGITIDAAVSYIFGDEAEDGTEPSS